MPNPCVPRFPQVVVRADGSTYTHYTTSPRSTISLTRDTTNNPLWAPFFGNKEDAESAALAGRLGRFNKRFDGLGGLGEDIDWMSAKQDDETTQKKSI
jgi:ribosomal protein L31